MTVQKYTAFDTKVKQKGFAEFGADIIPESASWVMGAPSEWVSPTTIRQTFWPTSTPSPAPSIPLDMDIAWK